jgi:arginase family enzyme
MTPIALLGTLLRPAGAGLHTVSTGRQAQLALQARLYGVGQASEVEPAWRRTLERIAAAKVVVLGVPSDCGAGLVRGAAFGPQALRAALLEAHGDFGVWAEQAGVVDAGDVAVVPQLLSDHMLSDEQRQASGRALYPTLAPEVAAALPVSPLSIAERALAAIFALNPRARLLVLGGDHSVAWPVVQALVRQWGAGGGATGGEAAGHLGIVQPDAHTDLLPERLGVKYCFATWAYHANDLIGRDGRLVQVGVRASSRPRAHWEGTLGVRQFWADELEARGEQAVLADIVAHLQARGVRRVYFSNDIDATDAEAAPSTGAPERHGLDPAFVRALVRRLGEVFELVAADLVEVAPPVGSADDARRTLALGAGYLWASLEALLASRPS